MNAVVLLSEVGTHAAASMRDDMVDLDILLNEGTMPYERARGITLF